MWGGWYWWQGWSGGWGGRCGSWAWGWRGGLGGGGFGGGGFERWGGVWVMVGWYVGERMREMQLGCYQKTTGVRKRRCRLRHREWRLVF